MTSENIAANYRYWQESGGGWAEEYDRRKRIQLYYHLEEAMLADYMGRQAPARVLEFGCGVGRHLRYLRDIPGIDIHGYDQSPTMVASIASWAGAEWFAQHVTVGRPVGALPYPDKSFDIVYTAEVLVHVRPEDLPGVLRELQRIARWQIYHLETAADFPLLSGDHYGCWRHDLVAAYGALGLSCEVLTQGYDEHRPCRVLLDPTRAPSDPPAALTRLYRRAQHDLQPALQEKVELTAVVAAEQERARTLQSAVEAERAKAREAAAKAEAALQKERDARTAMEAQLAAAKKESAQLLHQLQDVQNARSYRVANALNSAPVVKTLRRKPKVVIRALGTQHPEASGDEVRILAVRTSDAPAGLPLESIEIDPAVWVSMKDPHAPMGQALVSTRSGKAVLSTRKDAELRVDLQMGEGAGRVSIEAAGQTTIVDLFAKVPQRVSVYPFRESDRILPWTP